MEAFLWTKLIISFVFGFFVKSLTLTDYSISPICTNCDFGYPSDLHIVDETRALFYTDSTQHIIRRINLDNSHSIEVFAGRMGHSGFVNGVGTNAQFSSPNRICGDEQGRGIRIHPYLFPCCHFHPMIV